MKLVTRSRDGEVQEIELEDKPGGFTVVIHDQGMRVDVPEFVEVNPRNTLDCMAKMTQQQWEWISTGELFKELFNSSFDKNHRGDGEIPIPATIDGLNQGDYGVIHIAGMIVLGCEAMFAGRSVFFRNPETYLHPSSERMVATMLHKMLGLCGAQGVVTKVEEDPEKIKEEGGEVPIAIAEVMDRDWELTSKWLKLLPQKDFAKVGDRIYTTADMILEVANKTEIGKMMVEKFVAMGNGT